MGSMCCLDLTGYKQNTYFNYSKLLSNPFGIGLTMNNISILKNT